MKALEYLKKEREIKKHCADLAWGYYDKNIDEAIKEIEALEQSNKDLLNTIIEAQKVIKNVLEAKKWLNQYWKV